MMEYRKYNLETYTLPIWEGNIVYNETLMFVGEKEAPLLYYPDEIIAVLSSDLKTEYQEGVDYTLKDGKILLTENTTIPFFTLEEYYPKELKEDYSFKSNVQGHENIRYGEGDTFFKKQIHVTYKHSDKWTGIFPKKSEKLHRFMEKVSSGKEVTVLFFGDSITTGVNSSKVVGVAPYAACWSEMVIETMKKHFDNPNIKCVNTAVGGKNVEWGIETLQERAIDINPDLMILGFGMNDGWRCAEEFCSLTEQLLNKFSIACPESDVAVIATMLPHFRVAGFWGNQHSYEEGLISLCEKYSHVDVIPVTSMHKAILEKKRYYDMTGNNVNHPNDFMARIYAQTVNKVILG